MLRQVCFVLLIADFWACTRAYTAATCPSGIPENQRQDCYPESGSNENGCNARGCMWCESSYQGPPWCFHDDDTGITAPPGGDCTTCSCSNKIDCYPEPGSSETGCYDRGCLWCPSGVPNEPWCIVPAGGVTPPPPSSGCNTDIPESSRIDCYPGGGASQGGCESAGCIWCESNSPDVPWCFFNTTNLPEGIDDEERVNCIPEGGFSPDSCSNRGCVFASANSPGAPMCYFQNDKYGYMMVGDPQATYNGFLVTLERIKEGTLFGDDVDSLMMEVKFDTQSRLHIKFYDPAEDRFEVPLDIQGADPSPPLNPHYDIQFFNDPSFYFKVIRKSTGTVLIDTSLGGFTFSNQFLQFTTKVPSKTMYGFGEQEHATLAHDFEWGTFGMYARDQPPDPGANLYGVHPFYISVEDGGNSHGVLFLNSNAQDVQLTPAPGLVYRTIGGLLDIYVFLGPEPNAVVEQYSVAVGTTFMPPYWSLGFQLCRYGYGSLDKVKETVNRMDASEIPYDVQYGDIDYMDEQRDFTYDHESYEGLPDYVKKLQASGKHYIIILDPCLTKDDPPGTYSAYEEGEAMNVWVMESDGVTPLGGKVWPPGESVFPDFTNPDTERWWTNQCKSFHDTIPFDGLWIDMNEPANFGTGGTKGCETNALNNPPYKPAIFGGVLADKSICPDAKHKLGNHYDVHNLYGWSQSNATLISAIESTGKRPFVVSRSTFTGSGKWSAHWLGDNNSDWRDLRMSIIGMLEFNMFGIPYVGADICGFNGNVGPELCERWMELGAFYPFARNHNGIGYSEQDPAVFGDDFTRRTKAVMEIRYNLLPYLYTEFYKSHVTGSGIVLPLSFEFVEDQATHKIDQQFMWGKAFLMSPCLFEGKTTVDAYIPDARWYEYGSGAEFGVRGAMASLSAPLGTIPIHIRGGHVIPTQDSAVNTEASKHLPFGLIVALDDNGLASGMLYYDDLDSLDPIENGDYVVMNFDVQNNLLTASMSGKPSYFNNKVMGHVRILGVGSNPALVAVNGAPTSFTYTNQVVSLTNLNLPMASLLTISW